jgi:rod shape-determining protein MreC
MYNLLRFIKINQFLLLFLLLEGFSVFLLLENNSYQANTVIKFSTRYTGFIHNYTTLFSDYIALKETNNYLIEENAKLHALLKNETSFSDSTLIRDKHYHYYSAKIINNSVSKRNNFITLNKGSKHGIKQGMGVITKHGVIGIIYSVSQQYAIAISLLHRKSAIGILLKKNNHNGILKWKGFDYKLASINNFPNHIPIVIGDTITTNSHSVIFPEGVPIGTIKNIRKNADDGFFNVSVSLFEDFNQLNYVYIIHSDEAAEQLKLEQKIPEDE